jgi:hypothetical protein
MKEGGRTDWKEGRERGALIGVYCNREGGALISACCDRCATLDPPICTNSANPPSDEALYENAIVWWGLVGAGRVSCISLRASSCVNISRARDALCWLLQTTFYVAPV